MFFPQPTAPVGWTKQTVHDDKAVRVVAGATGGDSGGVWAFSVEHTVWPFEGHTLTMAEFPSHSHTQSGHVHNVDHYHGSDHYHGMDHTHSLAGHGHASNIGGNFWGAQTGGINFQSAGAQLARQAGLAGPSPDNTNWASQQGYPNTASYSATGFTRTASLTETGFSGWTGGNSADSGYNGSSAAHGHVLDFSVMYVDVMIAARD